MHIYIFVYVFIHNYTTAHASQSQMTELCVQCYEVYMTAAQNSWTHTASNGAERVRTETAIAETSRSGVVSSSPNAGQILRANTSRIGVTVSDNLYPVNLYSVNPLHH